MLKFDVIYEILDIITSSRKKNISKMYRKVKLKCFTFYLFNIQLKMCYVLTFNDNIVFLKI